VAFAEFLSQLSLEDHKDLITLVLLPVYLSLRTRTSGAFIICHGNYLSLCIPCLELCLLGNLWKALWSCICSDFVFFDAQASNENLPPNVIKQLAKELKSLDESPPDGIKVVVNDEDFSQICADIEGPGSQSLPYQFHSRARL